MLVAFKTFIKIVSPPILYFGGFVMIFITALKEARWGFLLLVFLIPQPNIWYKLHSYPLGKDYLDFLFVAVFLGIIFQQKGLPKTGSTVPIILLIIFTYLSLWNSSQRFSLPLPISLRNPAIYEFKNYAQMILLYFLTLSVVKDEEQKKTLIIIMSVVVLFIAFRNYRNFYGGAAFRYEKRATGPFVYVGLGPNVFAAFFAHYIPVFMALFLFEKDEKRKLLFLATTLFSIHPLFFAYSRGAYLASFSVLVFFGILKKRVLLILALIILLAWKTLLPVSVVDRIDMTVTEDGQIEHSAGSRPELWNLAYDLFQKHPIFGIGYGGYALSVGGMKMIGGVSDGDILRVNQDVHSVYMQILCEQGVIGFLILIMVLFMAFRSGWKLYRISDIKFDRGLGLGFMGCVLATAVTNLFGDRWFHYVLGAYFWILWGLVDRSMVNLSIPHGSNEDNIAIKGDNTSASVYEQ